MFASPVAIGAVFSIGAIGQYIAFVTPIGLKLFFARDKFRPGKAGASLPHHLKLISNRAMEPGPIFQPRRCGCSGLASTHRSRPVLPGRQGQGSQ
jgi:hypothetical protein